MKRFLSISIFIVFAMTSISALAQVSTTGPVSPLPFSTGEKLTYEGRINKFVSVKIGDLVFEVADANADGKIKLSIDARSSGTMLKLFRYSFIQQISTTANARDLFAYTATKHDVQKDKIRDSVTKFDYDKKVVTWIETNPNEPTQPPRTIASDIEGPTYEIVSGIYFLRTLPLAVGYSTSIAVSDSGLVYKIPVRVAARELQKTIFGNVWCFRVEPVVFGPGRFFEQKGKLEIWITDDARRIPVRARVNAEVGKVEIRLKEATNLK